VRNEYRLFGVFLCVSCDESAVRPLAAHERADGDRTLLRTGAFHSRSDDATCFWRAEKHTGRTGTSLETAIQSLVGSVTDDDLDRLAAEFERMAFATIPRRAMPPKVESSPPQVIQIGQNTLRARVRS